MPRKHALYLLHDSLHRNAVKHLLIAFREGLPIHRSGYEWELLPVRKYGIAIGLPIRIKTRIRMCYPPIP